MVLRGESLAQQVKLKVAGEIGLIKGQIGKSPKLAVLLVGDRRDSHTFIHIKEKACEQVGIETCVAMLPQDCEEKELLDVVANFNIDPDVHGIIVQLPLPQVIFCFIFTLYKLIVLVNSKLKVGVIVWMKIVMLKNWWKCLVQCRCD